MQPSLQTGFLSLQAFNHCISTFHHTLPCGLDTEMLASNIEYTCQENHTLKDFILLLQHICKCFIEKEVHSMRISDMQCYVVHDGPNFSFLDLYW